MSKKTIKSENCNVIGEFNVDTFKWPNMITDPNAMAKNDSINIINDFSHLLNSSKERFMETAANIYFGAIVYENDTNDQKKLDVCNEYKAKGGKINDPTDLQVFKHVMFKDVKHTREKMWNFSGCIKSLSQKLILENILKKKYNNWFIMTSADEFSLNHNHWVIQYNKHSDEVESVDQYGMRTNKMQIPNAKPVLFKDWDCRKGQHFLYMYRKPFSRVPYKQPSLETVL